MIEVSLYVYRNYRFIRDGSGRPGLPVSNNLHGPCEHKAALNMNCQSQRALELCESRDGRIVLLVPVDEKQQ